jgi:hypothetical protein
MIVTTSIGNTCSAEHTSDDKASSTIAKATPPLSTSGIPSARTCFAEAYGWCGLRARIQWEVF